jgi:hypothetical protein
MKGLSALALAGLFIVGRGHPRMVVDAQTSTKPAIVGRWDLVVQGTDGPSPAWLEAQRSGNHAIVGRFVGRVGSARPISRIEIEGDRFRFSIPPQWERGEKDLVVEGRRDGEGLSGTLIDPEGARSTWTGARAPALRRTAPAEWGTPIPLFNGADMSAWRALGESRWRVVNGVLTNAQAGANLVSRQTFNDFKLHLEFRYPRGGNSGVYLRGRHEVQIEDTAGREPASEHLGGIYGFIAPNEDAARPAGEWQTFDITLIGRLVTVVLNGAMVISRQEIPGITGGALDSDEGAPGPIMLQGDHGPVEFRNILLTPAR